MKQGVKLSIVIVAAAAAAAIGYKFRTPSGNESIQRQAVQKLAADQSHGDSTEMSDAKIAAAGIGLRKAEAVQLQDTLILNGVLRANQETLVQVTPRFPGVMREIRRRTGDIVQKGELLAIIESNQSLTSYQLQAPIAGTVIDRQVSLGEYASDQKPAFVVADLSSVWVDLSVYRQDLKRIHVGDVVLIDPEDGGEAVEAKVSYVSPIGSSETQSALARVVVANPDGRLRPGLFVRAKLLLAAKSVPIAVRLSALQTLDNETVVFVRDGNRLEARRVKIGERDSQHAEILRGLSAGDTYAADNSFIVKAEIGKGAADHD